MAKGWVKLDRSILDHSIWTSEPFSRGQAWIDLILIVNHEDKEIFYKGKLITVRAGSTITSVRKLSERWGWSHGKTTRFLKALQDADMVRTQNVPPNGTALSLVNYGKFQGQRSANGTLTEHQTEHQRNTDGNKQEYIKNDKEHKKAATGRKQNSFNNFPQRGYDFDSLEAQLLQAQQRGDANARNTETAPGSDE